MRIARRPRHRSEHERAPRRVEVHAPVVDRIDWIAPENCPVGSLRTTPTSWFPVPRVSRSQKYETEALRLRPEKALRTGSYAPAVVSVGPTQNVPTFSQVSRLALVRSLMTYR